MKRGAALATIVLVVAAAFVLLTLPAGHLPLRSDPDGTIPGNLHVHTTRSDGHNTPDEVAAIAARVGLKFIVFTDHGDATRIPDAPTYRSGVLCLDGVEISTSGGHLVALDMPAAPYPLGGDPHDVLEDVHRLGGFGIAAHPDSPKPGLRWTDWTVPVDGVEWINPDTSWRVHAAGGWRARLRLADAIVHYPFRAPETLAHLLTPISETTRNWSAIARDRRVVIISGADAHAKLASRNAEPGDNRFSLPLPSYEAVFSTLSAHVWTKQPLSGDAVQDAALLIEAIRAGHLYTAVDGFATPASFTFTATSARGSAQAGDELEAGGPVSLRVRSNAPPGFTTSLWHGTKILASGHSNDLSIQAEGEPGIYRAEIRLDDPVESQVWLVSNAIYLRSPAVGSPSPTPIRRPVTVSFPIVDQRPTGGWHVELDPDTTGSMETGERNGTFELSLRYGLPGDSSVGKSAALVWGPAPGTPAGLFAAYDRVTFRAHAERPMRISVQLRALASDGHPRRRWQRSVYLDATEVEHTVSFDEMIASPGTSPLKPPIGEVNAVMFVVDTTNTKPGSAGQFSIRGAALEK